MAAGGHDRAPPATLQRLFVGYVATMAAVAVVRVAVPATSGVAWVLFPLAAALAVAVGAVLNKPAGRARAPWYLLSAGLAAWAAEAVWAVATGNLARPSNPDLVDDLLESLGYVLSTLALLWLANRRVADEGGGLIDGLTLTCGLGILGWAVLVVPYVGGLDQGRGSWLDRSVELVYPLAGFVRFPLLAKLFAGGGGRLASVWLLAVGAVAGAVSDIAYAAYWLNGKHVSEDFGFSLGWVVFYAAWGAAALHPSMAEVDEPVPRRAAGAPWARIALLGCVCLIAPVALLGWALAHGAGELTALGAFASAAILLVLARLGLLFAEHRRAGERGRIVGEAEAAMGAAADVEEIAEVLGDAGRALFREPGHGRVLLAWADGDEPASHDGIVATAQLPERFVRLAEGQPAAVCLPLAASSARTRRKSAAVLAFGAPGALARVQESVEQLAGRAALAVDRLELGQEVRRRASEEYFRSLIQNAADGIVMVGQDRRIRYASPSAGRLFAPVRLVGRRMSELIGEGAAEEVRELLRGEAAGPVHWVLDRAGGRRFEIEVTAVDLRADPTVQATVLTLHDVTEQRALQAQLTEQALHDPLTGLPNRRQFRQRLEADFPLSSQSEPLYLVLLDLDDFKDINDTRGHSAGDELLRLVGDRLSAAVRPGDVAARIGGDEFAVLLGHVPTPGAAEALAARIVASFGVPFTVDGEPLSVGVSLGFASSAQGVSAEELMRNADLALYLAKSEGKRGWRRFTPRLHDDLIARAGMRAGLDQAIADHSIRMQYQPIVELRDGRVVGFEALVRLPHPSQGLIPPDRFIPLAEQTGQIVPLGRSILQSAAREAARWNTRSGHDGGVWVAVNVSGRQFADPGFLDGVVKTLDEYGLPAGLMVFELTETSLLQHNDEQVRQVLAALKQLGVRIALDDFGTGFSSLSYLTELPVDILKIDKSFVSGAGGSSGSGGSAGGADTAGGIGGGVNDRIALLDGIIHIADALGMAVIAEGIETSEQRLRLRVTHCKYGQGYFFARPMDPDAVHALLSSESEPRLPASD